MSINRDSFFPASSIGRVQGSAIQRSLSPSPSLREPLATHPLLSPSPSTIPTSPVHSPLDPTSAAYNTTARYVPYTPKNRVASAATTGTTTQPQLSLSPQQHHGDATSKLQVMNLKAAAQKLGLENGSLGWAILDRLVSETDQGSEWNEIWIALTIEQATLLLPVEQSSENISVELIKSHIIFCEEPLLVSSNPSHVPIVTLSGLRGTLSEQTLTIRSTLHSSSKVFQKILSPASRSLALASLPPLPSTTYAYPSFTVSTPSSAVSQLPLPPRPAAPARPPLPPRPGARQSAIPAQPSTPTSRITNPFASLFGSKPAVLPASPVLNPVTPSNPPQPEANESIEHPIDINAYTIDKEINFSLLAKSICKGLRDEVKTSLLLSKQSGMSEWIADMVVEWVEDTFFPFIKTKHGGVGYVVNGFSFEVEEISRTVQNFYSEVADAVIEKNKKHLKHRRLKKNPSGGYGGEDQASLVSSSTDEELSSSGEKENFSVSIDQGKDREDEKIRQVMERVEATICDLFYDRLFMPSQSDDLSHDEALSSRIAALNMLDLGLEHLGVEVEASARSGLHAVVKTCGQTMMMLDSPSCHRPVDKSALLVKAHKDLVDQLSRLPPVRLRPDDGPEHSLHDINKTPRIGHSEEKEMESMSSQRVNTDDDDDVASVNNPATTSLDPEDPQSLSNDASLAPPSTLKPTPVSGDVILPLLIFSVVKYNPPRLLSHLLFIERFRNQGVGGEESYCLINLMAVAEFLENVDLTHLGLDKESEQVVSTADLSPIPVLRSRSLSIGSGGSSTTTGTTESRVDAAMRLRGRVEQQVDAIAGSANKVLSGVVDSSFGVLRALLPGNAEQTSTGPSTVDAITQEQKGGFALLRKDSGFSIANLAASLPGARPRPSGVQQQLAVAGDDENGQQMMEVSSRPNSRTGQDGRESNSEDSGESEDEEEDVDEAEEGHDVRSIRSFESMMSKRKKRRRKLIPSGRKSIADRLASVPGLGRLSSSHDPKDSPPESKRSSLLPVANRIDSPLSTRAPSPITLRIAPPNQRFLECSEDDLRLSEVKELLREYKRVVEGMQTIGGFHE